MTNKELVNDRTAPCVLCRDPDGWPRVLHAGWRQPNSMVGLFYTYLDGLLFCDDCWNTRNRPVGGVWEFPQEVAREMVVPGTGRVNC